MEATQDVTNTASDRNLKFEKTYTVEQFKARELVDSIEVKQNPHTGKLFIVFGGETGRCSKAGVPKKPMVSWVTDENGENGSYLLHEKGEGGAPTLAIL